MPLRKDEEFVITALAVSQRGIWHEGEDPPDAYLDTSGGVVAVEISTLTQRVPDIRGVAQPRLSQDAPALSLANELDRELFDVIPDGVLVLLTLWTPIDKVSKTRALVSKRIAGLVAAGEELESDETFLGNRVLIRIARWGDRSERKVLAAIANRHSDTNILNNAWHPLEERIAEKAKKCSAVSHRPIWLALLNDYWLADLETYRQAFLRIRLKHPFQKIAVVGGDATVGWLL